jgi:hypothetical protein
LSKKDLTQADELKTMIGNVLYKYNDGAPPSASDSVHISENSDKISKMSDGTIEIKQQKTSVLKKRT